MNKDYFCKGCGSEVAVKEVLSDTEVYCKICGVQMYEIIKKTHQNRSMT